ncbi:hypothetical protein PUMCH_003198 [Australozyma saopauloensis]|uniref:GP-PDE domain-containing protein n=1 Tax=Australozyma saopauloensis TaxID=291208 RepID=A0AAX4HBQ0_9ASCO|nr:hypothetical protein PUMCH_003198 [[Candida] saopauloensis]
MVLNRCLVVGHRGFKAKYTENTLNGFYQCFQTGAKSFETDVWTTKDHVLVISHDVNTKRIFCDEDGNEADYNILETDYEVLKPLRTIASGEPLLKFTDVLEWFLAYVKQHEAENDYRIMLDLKAANPPVILKLLMKDMLSVHPDLSWWFSRIQFGVWHMRFVKYLNQDPEIQSLLQEAGSHKGYKQFDLLHISLNWQSSMLFLSYNEYLNSLPKDRFKFKVTGVSIIYTSTWSPSFVKYFLPAIKKQNLSLYSWTINLRLQLEYFRHLCSFATIHEYGIITDHPDKLESLCDAEVVNVGTPKASFFQLLLSYILNAIIRMPKVDDGSFESPVDPMKAHPARMTLGRRMFAFLQHMNVF